MSLISFLFGFSDAFLIYFLSSYFKEASGVENVSLFYLTAFTAVLIALLYLHTLIRKLGKSFLLNMLFLSLVLVNFGLILLPASIPGALLAMAHLVLVNLIWVNLDIILEGFSTDNRSGRIRGLYLTITNAGFLLAPFVASKVLERFGFDGIFTVGLIMASCILTLVMVGLRRVNHRFREKITPRQIFRKVEDKPDVLRVFHISFTIEFFYSVMIVYTPLYLLHLGMRWDDLGIAFTAMLLPFVLLQYPLGLLADRKWGEKEMLIVAILLMGVSSGLLVFVTSSKVWVWAVMLFLTRVGVAAIEVLRDSYFYKRIDAYDVDIIAFFRMARPAANIAAAILTGVALLVFPLWSVFALVALNSFIGLFSALTLEDNESEREVVRREAVSS